MLRAAIVQLDRRSVQAAILLLAAVAFCVPRFLASWNEAGKLPHSWSSATFWVKSADCARRTGAILVICQDDRLVPIADIAAGDDPGLPLVMGLHSALTGSVSEESDVSRINSAINYVGVLSLAALFFWLRLSFLAFLVLTVGPELANAIHGLGPHPGHFGAACLAALLPLAILGIPVAGLSRRQFRLWIFIGLVGLAVAMLFREAIGLMGVLAALIAVAITHGRSNGVRWRSAIVHLAIVAAIILSIATPKAVLRARDVAFGIAPSTRMEQHGAWHNLYIGLGAVDNPFGLAYDDDYGIRAVAQTNPAAGFLTNEYYAILRQEYFRILLQHPLQVADVYRKKLKQALSTYSIWVILLIVAIVYSSGRIASRRLRRGWIVPDTVVVVSGVFVASFLGQAVLFHPSGQYLYPVKIFLLMLSGISIMPLLILLKAETTEK